MADAQPKPNKMPDYGVLPGKLFLNPQIAPKVPPGAPRPFAPGEYVQNPSGSWSSEITNTVQMPDGSWAVVPSLWIVDGKPTRVNEDTAAEYAQKSGLPFQKFPSEDVAESFSTKREGAWQGISPQNASSVPALWGKVVDASPAAATNVIPLPTSQPTGGGDSDALIQSLLAKLGKSSADLHSNVVPIRQKQEAIQGQINAIQPPPAPDLKPIPTQAPDPQITDPLKAMGSPMMLMALLGGALTGAPITAALTNATGFLKGIHAGDQEATKDHLDQFNTNLKAAQEANSAALEKYRAAFDQKHFDMDKLTSELRSVASEYGDPITMHQLENGDLHSVFEMVEARQKNADALEAHRDALNLRVDSAWGPTMSFTMKDGKTVQGEKNKITGQYRNSAGEPIDGKNVISTSSLAAAQTPETPEQRQATAAMTATGMPLSQVAPGYGQSATAKREQAKNDAIALIMQQHPDMTAADAGVELANRTIAFQSGKKSEGQLVSMLGATKQAVSQLDFNIAKAKEEMAKLGSSNLSPIVNAIARGEEKWTGEPAYSSLFYYMHAAAVESARVLSGGQSSVAQLHQGAMEEAQKWANINMTPASFDAVADAMHEEGRNRIETYETAINSQKIGGGSGEPPKSDKPNNDPLGLFGGTAPQTSKDDPLGLR